jgi:hypothetical protein
MKNSKENVISSVQSSVSSIFSKEDVINLINSIQEEGRKISVNDIQRAIDNVVCSLENNEDEIVDRDSIEFSVNYDNRIEVDNLRINFDYIREALENTFMDLGEVEEEVKEEESSTLVEGAEWRNS